MGSAGQARTQRRIASFVAAAACGSIAIAGCTSAHSADAGSDSADAASLPGDSGIPRDSGAPVRTGDYTLHVLGLDGGLNLGLGFDWDGGVEFSGHIDDAISPVRLCTGRLDPAEAERITRAVNDAGLFAQGDIPDPGSSDWAAIEVTIETVDSERSNRFCYPNHPTMTLGDFVGALRDPVWRLWKAGACDGPEVELVRSTPTCFEGPRS